MNSGDKLHACLTAGTDWVLLKTRGKLTYYIAYRLPIWMDNVCRQLSCSKQTANAYGVEFQPNSSSHFFLMLAKHMHSRSGHNNDYDAEFLNT
jgi:hypothetical protein